MTLKVDINWARGPFALNARFAAPSGVTMIFGASGAGKTTVLNAVAGLLRPQNAHISMGGDIWQNDKIFTAPYKRNIGYVFQDARLFPHLTVLQNINYSAKFRPVLPKKRQDTVIDILNLGALLDRRPNMLSGGEAQRVALARALVSNPSILCCDEPLAALDKSRKRQILTYFEHLRDEFDLPILYVTHDHSEMLRLADQLVVLQNGQMQHCGSVFDVLGDPAQVLQIDPALACTAINLQIEHIANGLAQGQTMGQVLRIAAGGHKIGDRVKLRIAAKDVILAQTAPVGLSALNTVKARITALSHTADGQVLVQMRIGDDKILALVTQYSAQNMGLAIDAPIYAVIKASSVDIL